MSSVVNEVERQITSIVGSDRVVVFMKGDRQAPQCGFSAQVVKILDQVVPSYTTFDVLEDPLVREGIKSFSDWPTIPQLYIDGEFQGGCDIIKEMYASGELHRALGLERVAPEAISITVTDGARTLLEDAQRRYGGEPLHLSIDASFGHSFGFGPAAGGELTVDVGGLSILLDPDSATRANGLEIATDTTPQGMRLRIDNPNQPALPSSALASSATGNGGGHGSAVTAAELQAKRLSGEPHRLIDVRTPDEREIASIEGSELLDQDKLAELEALPKDTALVFHCHHDARARGAAQRFVSRGFTRVAYLSGGIEAWAREIDRSVPRY